MAMLSYFDRFPGFLPNCRANIENEFHRLAMLKNWKEGKAEWKKQWNTCCKVELNAAFAGDEGGNTKLQGWQDLCYEVGIRPAPPSITQCKKALRKVHVNLVELMNARRNARQPRLFKSYDELMKWTFAKKGRQFPRELAKEDGFVRVLLKRFK